MFPLTPYSSPSFLPARTPKSPCPAPTRWQLGHFAKHRRLHLLHEQLREAIAAMDRERLTSQVDQDDLQLTAVVGVNRRGGIGEGDAMLEGEAGARARLQFVALRDGDREAGR